MAVRHVLGLSGKDSLATALIIKAHKPELWEEVELFTTLTGADYPETLEWLDRLPKLFGKPIHHIEGDLHSSIKRYTSLDRAFLPSVKQRYCTKEAKLKPFEAWAGDRPTVLYTGIRADETRIGYKANGKILSEFPLAEFGIDLQRVWQLILGLPEEYRPPTFYWAEIHELSRQAWRILAPLVGGELDDHLTFTQKTILMAGRSRPNCFFCFNQRRYEVVWLYETHPDLFWHMMGYEKPEYSWLKGFPLADLTRAKREGIKWKRACAIASAVAAQSFLKLNESDGFEGMQSCGLFCGK